MSACTTRENLWKILDLFEELSVTCWLDGGWGVDALYGKQTRDHRDIDINFDAAKTQHILILSEALRIHLRDLLQCLIQTGKELTHYGSQLLRGIDNLVMKLMQVHGDCRVLTFGSYGKSHIGLPLQLFYLLDGHISFRMAGLRRILRDIQEFFIAHRHSQARPESKPQTEATPARVLMVVECSSK